MVVSLVCANTESPLIKNQSNPLWELQGNLFPVLWKDHNYHRQHFNPFQASAELWFYKNYFQDFFDKQVPKVTDSQNLWTLGLLKLYKDFQKTYLKHI